MEEGWEQEKEYLDSKCMLINVQLEQDYRAAARHDRDPTNAKEGRRALSMWLDSRLLTGAKACASLHSD